MYLLGPSLELASLFLLGNSSTTRETSKEVCLAFLSAIFRLKLLGFGISWIWFNSTTEASWMFVKARNSSVDFGTDCDSNPSITYSKSIIYTARRVDSLALFNKEPLFFGMNGVKPNMNGRPC